MTLETGSARGRSRLRSFHELMQQRVQRILFISSLYDCFIMSEEGHLQETLLSHFMDLNVSQIPDLIQVKSAGEALELLDEDPDFDLVVTSLDCGDGDASELPERLRARGHELPVVALAYTSRDLREFLATRDVSGLSRVFLWQGDVRILLAIVLSHEDRLNAERDTRMSGVPAILVVEDSVRFYSSFLPEIYSELFRHTHRLLSEDLNVSQQILRMRGRPKVLLCTSFEEAWETFDRYAADVIGIVSDFEFPLEGELWKDAGLQLCARARARRPDLRLIMQSSEEENRLAAEEIGASFLLKGSALLLHELREVLVDRWGFGDFVFRTAGGRELDRAKDLAELAQKVREIPDESLLYHAERNHFSKWLKARTEFSLAERLSPRSVADFAGPDDLRTHLLSSLESTRLERRRTVIASYDRKRFDPEASITRIGEGSLGGKARGVAFANRLLHDSGLDERYPDVELSVPPALVLATGVFDEFLEYERIRDFAMGENPDDEILQHFLAAPFPREAHNMLRSYLQRVKYPLAVRSSSLLEDSLSQPFAGIYQTHMLPNNDPRLDVRLAQLVGAVKRVFASTFTEQAKSYLGMTSFRLEEEKMGVMIQQLVGLEHGDRFYPDFAGVARSYNFYPEPGHTAEDGVAAVGLGMGRAVVGGDACLRFCPNYPKQLVTFSSVDLALENSQREFWAITLERGARDDGVAHMRRFPLEVAEADGRLGSIGSTYSHDDRRIVDGVSRPGVRLVSFAQVLKHEAFPLAPVLRDLLALCQEGTGSHVEIEYAGHLKTARRPGRFSFLQLRPLAQSSDNEPVDLEEVEDSALVCRSPRVLGNGRLEDLHDVLVCDLERFDRQKTPEIAREVAHFDALLRKEGRPYVLIGAGRWGSSDPHLGIPVGWNQIAGAGVIVEAGFEDLRVEPSQGTHFFQNLTSSSVGYFTVNPDVGEGFVDWAWLAGSPAVEEGRYVRRLSSEAPFRVTMSGRSGAGVIHKPLKA